MLLIDIYRCPTGGVLLVLSYAEALTWLHEPLKSGKKPHLLLGNGFSMALDAERFDYSALAQRAVDEELLSDAVQRVMRALGTTDFEVIIQNLIATATILEALGDAANRDLADTLRQESDRLREALAKSVAGLHPDRPYDIAEEQYLRTRVFLDQFDHIFTVNYDLLLYWALMQDLGEDHPSKSRDDGFRDSGITGEDTVLWDLYDPHKQTVYYLHGALHLFLGVDGLRKITWIRTENPLIDQVRFQLGRDRFPLYVAEGDSGGKMDKINRSAYLSKGMRSLAGCGGTLAVYGHSLAENDAHVLTGIIRSRICRVAVAVYGELDSDNNKLIIRRARDLVLQREQDYQHRGDLEVEIFDATAVPLW